MTLLQITFEVGQRELGMSMFKVYSQFESDWVMRKKVIYDRGKALYLYIIL